MKYLKKVDRFDLYKKFYFYLQRGLFGVIRTIAHQLLVMYLFRQVFMVRGNWDPVQLQYITGSPGTNVSAPVNASWPPAHNLFFPGQHYDLSVYLHDKIDFSVSDATLFWQLQDLEFGNWNEGPNKVRIFAFYLDFSTGQRFREAWKIAES